MQNLMDRQKLLETIAGQLSLDDDRQSLWTDQLLSQPGPDQSFAICKWLSHRIKIEDEAWRFLAAHANEIIREWAAILVGLTDRITFARKLAWIKPFADDEHYDLREMACLALRREVIRDPVTAIHCLVPWTGSRNERLRRFASEITRPREVGGSNIQQLLDLPELGLPILEPLRADESEYVQNSVCKWLSDASKSNPEWVQATTRRWLAESTSLITRTIVQRVNW